MLPSVRYCITLDSDTRLPRDAAKRLIGIIAHPLNRPHFDRGLGPRHRGLRHPAAARQRDDGQRGGSLFARTYAGHTGVDPYTTAVSDVYQDLFGEGIFTGKGLYDVDAFAAALDGRVPENALLSHDLFEALRAHGARDRHRGRGRLSLQRPRARAAAAPLGARRLADSLVAVSVRAVAHGLVRNRLPLIARWKILDNLRRSLMPPATLLLLVLGWTVLPGARSSGPAVGLAAPSFPRPVRACSTLLRGPRRGSRGASSCARRSRI